MPQNVVRVKIEVDDSVVRFGDESGVLWTGKLPDDPRATLHRVRGHLSPASREELADVLKNILGPSEPESLFQALNDVASRHAGDARALALHGAAPESPPSVKAAPESPPSAKRELLDALVQLPWELALDDVNRPLVSTFVHLDAASRRSAPPEASGAPSGDLPPRSDTHADEPFRILCVFADPTDNESEDAPPGLARRRILETCFGRDGDVIVEWLQYGVSRELLAQRFRAKHYSVLYLSGTKSGLDALAPFEVIQSSHKDRPHLVVLDVRRNRGGAPEALPGYAALAERLVVEAQVGAVITMRHAVSATYSRHFAMGLLLVLMRRAAEATLAAMLREARTDVRAKEIASGEHDLRDDGAPILFGNEACPIPAPAAMPSIAAAAPHSPAHRHGEVCKEAMALRQSKIECARRLGAVEEICNILEEVDAAAERSGFVGRRDELRELGAEWLMDGSRRPVAIISGYPGSGKSWLAAEVVECWYPELDRVIVRRAVAEKWHSGMPDDILAELSGTRRARVEGAHRPDPELIAALAQHLALNKVLLILDEADESCCELLRALSSKKDCKARVLVTSVDDLPVAEGSKHITLRGLGPVAVDHYVSQFEELRRGVTDEIRRELGAQRPGTIFALGAVKRVAKRETSMIPDVLRGVREGWISWRAPRRPSRRPTSLPEKPRWLGWSIVTGGVASLAFAFASCGSQWPFTSIGWRPVELSCDIFEPDPSDAGPQDGARVPDGDAAADAESDAAAEASAPAPSHHPGCDGCAPIVKRCVPGTCANDGECEPACAKIECGRQQLYCSPLEVAAKKEKGVLSGEMVKRKCEDLVQLTGQLAPRITLCSTNKDDPMKGALCECH